MEQVEQELGVAHGGARDDTAIESDAEEEEAACGAFEDVQDELIELILELLPLRDQLRCAMVCRRFYLVAVETLQCRQNLDLQPHFDIVNDRFLAFLGPKLVSLEQLSLSWCGSSSPIHDSVDGDNGGAGSGGGASSDRGGGSGDGDGGSGGGGRASGLTLDAAEAGAAASIVAAAPQIMVTPLALCSLVAVLPRLRVLRLACCAFVNDDALASVASCCPLLLEVDLSRCFNISSGGFGALERLACLKRLNLYNTEAVGRLSKLPAVFTACSALEHVNLGHPPIMMKGSNEAREQEEAQLDVSIYSHVSGLFLWNVYMEYTFIFIFYFLKKTKQPPVGGKLRHYTLT